MSHSAQSSDIMGELGDQLADVSLDPKPPGAQPTTPTPPAAGAASPGATAGPGGSPQDLLGGPDSTGTPSPPDLRTQESPFQVDRPPQAPHSPQPQGPMYNPAFEDLPDEQRGHLPPHPPSSHEATDPEPIRVFIKAEPEKVETMTALGIKKSHIEYVIRVDSSIPGMVAHGLEVRRRFSDFDALHKILKQEYEGFFLPPLPEKSYIDGHIARDSFLRLRRADLQAFLKNIASHPVLRECQAVSTFLLSPGELACNPAWTYMLRPPQPPPGTQQGPAINLEAPAAGLIAGLDNMVSWMSKVTQQPPKPVHQMSAEEQQLRQSADMLKELHKLLSSSSEIARSLCGRYDDVASELFRLGRDFASLSRFDEIMMGRVGQYTEAGISAGNRANELIKVASANHKQQGTWKTLSLRTAASLVTLHDYATLLPEALAALEVRESALAHTWELEDDLDFKQHQLTQLNSEPGTEEKRVRMSNYIKQLEAQINASYDRYKLLTQRNLAELRRVNLERESDFRRMLLQFSKCQASLIRQSAEMWDELVQAIAD